MKWWRRVAALPNPTSPAIHSMDRSDCSSSSSARCTRCRVTHACGVAPVEQYLAAHLVIEATDRMIGQPWAERWTTA